MDLQDSRESFRQADALFRLERYPEALTILEELDNDHPNTKNILFPTMLCLEKLEQYDQALTICEQLIKQHCDPRAREIEKRLKAAQDQSGFPGFAGVSGEMEMGNTDIIPGMHGIDELLDLKPKRPIPPPVPVNSGVNWKRSALIGMAIISIIIAAVSQLI